MSTETDPLLSVSSPSEASLDHGRWDLSDLFQGHDDPALAQGLEQSLQMACDFEKKYRGTIHVPGGPTPEHLLQGLVDLESLDELASRVGAFSSLLFAEDTQDPRYQDLSNRVDKQLTELHTHLIFFDLEWLELDDEVAQALIAHPTLASYSHYLKQERASRPYRRSEAEEKILSRLRPTGPGAWMKLFDEINNSLRFPVMVRKSEAPEGAGEKAAPTRKRQDATLAEVSHRLHDADRAIRKDAFRTLYEVLGQERVCHASRYTYNTLVEDHLVRDEIRGYPSFMAARHLSNETTDEMVQAMLGAVERHYPLAHRYFKMKARLLGLGKLELFDQYAPLPSSTPDYDLPLARRTVIDAYHAFEPRFGEMAAEFFEQRWIDLYPRPGKRSGAFCYSPTPKLHPYVLTNFVGTARDVMTIAHELGHAIHGQLSRGQTPLNYHPPLTTCETASVFGESLTFDHMLRGLDEEAELALLCGTIEDTFATVYRQTVLTRFEESVFARRKEGLLTQEDLNQAWLGANAPYYGDAVKITSGYELGWSYIPHFFHSRFYCYSYVFGQLLTLSLYRMYREQGREFVPKYVEMLSAGSSRSPADLFAPFGVNLEDPEFWDRGFVEVRALVERAEALLNAIGGGRRKKK